MTEAEREELIEKMNIQIVRAQYGDCAIGGTDLTRTRTKARAALAVAEPVIREWCARIADKTPYAFNVAKDMNTIAAAIREGGKGNENNA